MITLFPSQGYFCAIAGEGFEYHLLAIGIALALIIMGGGAWSLDRALSTAVP